MRPSPRDLYASFASHNVKYLLIGGAAAITHGVNRITVDVDVLIEATPENAAAVLDALVEIGLGTATLITPQELLSQQVTIFEDLLPVDVHTQTPGIRFEEAWARRRVESIDGVRVDLLSLNDLIASKEAAGRPVDLEDVTALRQLRGSQQS
jgi:predicted nucleotidyltransferase